MTTPNDKVRQKAAKLVADFDARIEAESSAHGKAMLEAEKELALKPLGRQLVAVNPAYSSEEAAFRTSQMTEEELHASIAELSQKPEDGSKGIREDWNAQTSYDEGNQALTTPEEVAEAMKGAKTSAQIADVMRRAGLSGDYT